MGASNVAAVYASWTDLPDRAFRALAFMALISLDDDKPPRYWGGRDDLARAIGRVVPPRPQDADTSAASEAYRKARTAAFEAVRAAIADLQSAGVVVRVSQGYRGRNTEYALHLHGRKVQSQPAPLPQAQPGPSTQAHPAKAPGSPWAKTQAGPTPEEETGTTRTPQDTTTAVGDTTSRPLRRAFATAGIKYDPDEPPY